ncbi:hypothetical protein BVC80_9025g31 [Macleaya cordata]|uniref:Uncharacterized protein n=1 Tax=Macleaya cordata TaxID=56857 RepID=A0A200QUV6_MACCD|nr:hypothetical protein BVC80_9025g31 [Macleaya cordata]
MLLPCFLCGENDINVLTVHSGGIRRMSRQLRDAYVNLMLRLAGNIVSLNNGNVFGGTNKRIVNAEEVSKAISPSEYEERLVFEIYKVLVASQ